MPDSTEPQRWALSGLKGWKFVVALAGGIVAISAAATLVAGVLFPSNSVDANFRKARVEKPVTWDEFKARRHIVKEPGSVTAVVMSVILLAQTGSSSTSTPEGTTDTTPTDTTPTDTTPTGTTPTGTTPTGTTSTGTTSTGTTSTDATPTTATEPLPPPIDAEQIPASKPVALTPPQHQIIKRLSHKARERFKLPRGCERSITVRSCPASVDLGAVPGPAGSAQGAPERYPFTDQKRVLDYLLRTLPKVRYLTKNHHRVPVGVHATVKLAITGNGSHRLKLLWSVYPRGESGAPPLAWEENRTADIITAGPGAELIDFWVPIPGIKHGYILHLRVVEGDKILDEQDASPTFR
jgi:hypothetical protein